MSKMKMPEMSVVRFNESDVIVASSDRLTLVKYGDGEEKNAYVYYNGAIYGAQQQGGGSFPTNLYDAFNSQNPGANFSGSTDFHWDGTTSETWSTANFSSITGYDATTNVSNVDGTYIWTGSDFVHQ